MVDTPSPPSPGAVSPAPVTTPQGGAPSPIPYNGVAGGATNVVAPLTTPAFPSPYATPLQQVPATDNLQTALNTAITKGGAALANVAFCIAALDPVGGPYPMAMTPNANNVYYAASMMKVAALYTLFELRNTVRAIAAELGSKATPSDLLTRAQSYLGPQYYRWASNNAAMRGIAYRHAVPKLSSVFTCTAGSPNVGVDFSPEFAAKLTYGSGDTVVSGGHIGRMTYWSQNLASAMCIRGCGYGAINGILANAGFFASQSGIWLAGDYEEQTQDKTGALTFASKDKYPAFRIPSQNDGPPASPGSGNSAQATSAFQMVNLFALMFKAAQGPSPPSSGPVPPLFGDATSSAEMMNTYLSGDLGHPPPSPLPQGPNETWMNRTSRRNYEVTNGKLGVGPLNSGGDVYSETSILLPLASSKKFVVSWVNLVSPGPVFQPVVDVASAVIAAYLNPSTSSPSTGP
jgi:hypothetical protein